MKAPDEKLPLIILYHCPRKWFCALYGGVLGSGLIVLLLYLFKEGKFLFE